MADASERPARRHRTREGTDPGWLWQAFAAPGLLWLVALFIVPFYAILAVAMGTIDPLFGLDSEHVLAVPPLAPRPGGGAVRPRVATSSPCRRWRPDRGAELFARGSRRPRRPPT